METPEYLRVLRFLGSKHRSIACLAQRSKRLLADNNLVPVYLLFRRALQPLSQWRLDERLFSSSGGGGSSSNSSSSSSGSSGSSGGADCDSSQCQPLKEECLQAIRDTSDPTARAAALCRSEKCLALYSCLDTVYGACPSAHSSNGAGEAGAASNLAQLRTFCEEDGEAAVERMASRPECVARVVSSSSSGCGGGEGEGAEGGGR